MENSRLDPLGLFLEKHRVFMKNPLGKVGPCLSGGVNEKVMEVLFF